MNILSIIIILIAAVVLLLLIGTLASWIVNGNMNPVLKRALNVLVIILSIVFLPPLANMTVSGVLNIVPNPNWIIYWLAGIVILLCTIIAIAIAALILVLLLIGGLFSYMKVVDGLRWIWKYIKTGER